MARRNNNQAGNHAGERTQFAVRDMTGSKVSNQHHFNRIQQLRDVLADELADAREQQQGL